MTEEQDDDQKVTARTFQYAKNILLLYYFGLMDIGWAWTEYAQYDCRLLSEKEKIDLNVILWFNGLQITFHPDWQSDERNNAILRGTTEFHPGWIDKFGTIKDEDPEATQRRLNRHEQEREKAISKFRSTYDQMIAEGCTIEQLVREAFRDQRKSLLGPDFDSDLQNYLALFK